MERIKIFILTAVIFLIIDIIWLTCFAKKMYLNDVSQMLLMSDGSISPRIWPAIIVYIILTIGLSFLVIPAANGSIMHALIYGAIFGLATYGTYNFTNLSILKEWSTTIALFETLYGAIAGAVTAGLVVFFTR